MAGMLKTISPVDGRVCVERPYADDGQVAQALHQARRAHEVWRAVPVAERAEVVSRAVDAIVAATAEIANEITRQMGRPIAQSPGEIGGFADRARHMIAIAAEALADVAVAPKPGFTRFIRRQPIGPVFVVAPWNYPWLTSVNCVVPALMAGNSVILKASAQTPLVAERYAEAFEAADAPTGVFQFLHLDHEMTGRVVKAPEISFVAFTGSVAGGRMVEGWAQGRFIGVGLELGGNDPAYVRPDADLRHAVAGLVDGAFYNSGQSCCAVERIYVHEQVYDDFVADFAALTGKYLLGDPTDAATTLGPMVRAEAADAVRERIEEATAKGARALIDPRTFPADRPGTAYLAPQVLVDVDHSMAVMSEETFGPAVGIMRVASDQQAVELMNDSRYGLTASVWTTNEVAAMRIGNQVDTGTWFMNRCDYLDPALAWTGVKDSGRGASLSTLGYQALTRPKSFHLKTKT